jgi:hypothetical protein
MTEPALPPDTPDDEREVGWGDETGAAPDEGVAEAPDYGEWLHDEQLREERPPHYDRD